MTTMTPAPDTVTGGVDTQSDMHVAAAVDHLGGVLGTKAFPTTPKGYRQLLRWLQTFGLIFKVGKDQGARLPRISPGRSEFEGEQCPRGSAPRAG